MHVLHLLMLCLSYYCMCMLSFVDFFGVTFFIHCLNVLLCLYTSNLMQVSRDCCTYCMFDYYSGIGTVNVQSGLF